MDTAVLAIIISAVTFMGTVIGIIVNVINVRSITQKDRRDYEAEIIAKALFKKRVDDLEINCREYAKRINQLESDKNEIVHKFTEFEAQIESLTKIMNRMEGKLDRHIEIENDRLFNQNN